MRHQDAQLIEAFLRGDRRAVRRIDGWIRTAAVSFRRRLGDDWEDVVQDCCLRLTELLRADRFAGDARLETYVWRVTNNTCVDRIRRHFRWQWLDVDDAQRQVEELALAEPDAAGRHADRDFLATVLARVPAHCRRLWALILDGLSYQEMSRRLGVSSATLRVQVLRCRKAAAARRRELDEES